MKKVILLILGLAVSFVASIYLNSEGQPNMPIRSAFREFDIVEPAGEETVSLKFAPDGWNQEELTEETIATLSPGETGIIKQGGDIESPCIYFNWSWWCRIEPIGGGRGGWTRASNVSRP